MTDKPADNGPAPEADEAAPTTPVDKTIPEPAAPGAPAESGTLPLPADEPVTAEQSTVQAGDQPTAAAGEQPTPERDEPTTDIPVAGPTPPGDIPQPPPGSYMPPGSYTPPGGFAPPPPPPGGFAPPPLRPTGGALADKYGLVRPKDGRWIAGVCAAIGRATNTDPVLWRVLLGVLTLFGGVGVLVYLLGWLLIPNEGDTASPAEALIGRGQSSTSAPITLGLGILAVIAFVGAFSGDVRTALVGGAVLLGAALLVQRGRQNAQASAPPPPPVADPPPGPYPPGFNPMPVYAESTTPMDHSTTTEPPTGYRPPFAPYGPYASSNPYAPTSGYPYPGLAPTTPAPPVPRPPRQRSRLGRVVLSMICLAMGTLVVVDVSGASIPGTAYLAAALGVIGLGLLVGTWLGRARWLIFPGVVMTFALIGAVNAPNWDGPTARPAENITWTPASVNELQSAYSVDVGNGVLDLSKVDFRDRQANVDVNVDVGNLTVIVPPEVDVDVAANVDAGNATIFGRQWSGLGNDEQHIHDDGPDGPGGGKLLVNATVDLGKLEVRR
jgi:phage shock protein PspC (stress-responsive transcriptional regulator)